VKAKAIRLPEGYLNIVKEICEKEKLDEATIIRKLLKVGAERYIAELYESGAISIREVAGMLGLSVSEAIDFLLTAGVRGNIRTAQVIKSLERF